MKKILQVGMSSNYGGIEKVVYELVKDNKEFDISILNLNVNPIAYESQLLEKGFKIFDITPRFVNYKKYKKDIIACLKNNNFDIIHFHLMTYSIFDLYLLAKKYSNAKIIIHSHAEKKYLKWCSLKTKILHIIGKFLIRGDVNLACSKAAGNFFFNNKKFQIVYNGTDIEKFEFKIKDREEIRNQLDIKDNEVLIGNVGLISKNKNQLKTLKIFKEYLMLNKDGKMIFIGKSTKYKKFYNYIKKNNLEKRIIMLENITDIEKYYSAMDYFLFNSLTEGFGVVLIEAQINGLKSYVSESLRDNEIEIGDKIEFIEEKEKNEFWAKKINSSDINYDRRIDKSKTKEYSIESMKERVTEIWKKI